jgi:hypothetical protein
MNSPLAPWHEFYGLLGTAAAGLVALLFVAVSIGANILSPERTGATRTYMSPVVFHYTGVLFVSLIALVLHLSIRRGAERVGRGLAAVAGRQYPQCLGLDARLRAPLGCAAK